MAREPKGLGAVDRHVVAILAEAVEAAGLSQRDVESRTRISQGRIGKILRGETPAPSIGESDGHWFKSSRGSTTKGPLPAQTQAAGLSLLPDVHTDVHTYGSRRGMLASGPGGALVMPKPSLAGAHG